MKQTEADQNDESLWIFKRGSPVRSVLAAEKAPPRRAAGRDDRVGTP